MTPESLSYLVIDDNQVFAATLARSLEKSGNKVAISHTAEQALLENQRSNPARIILDLKLEKSSGLTLIEPLKQHNPNATIVVLTGYSSISTAVEAIKLGAHQYLCKPASIAEIIRAFNHQTNPQTLDLAQNPPSVNRLQWEHIQEVLNQHNGNVSATARALGMHRRTLQRKLLKKPTRS
ncbi:MAG: response regulator [Immundisolibacteraceae bacterium]|nr:response regulator [Immundisolibacteraceae bacterium]